MAIFKTLVARCSKSSSLRRHTHTFGDASAELWIDLVEVLELSLLGGNITHAKMSSDIVHSRIPHFFVKDLIEKGARLLIVGVRVNIGVPSDRSSGFLGMNCVLLIFLWSGMLSWLIIRGTAITSRNIHDSITLVVCWS